MNKTFSGYAWEEYLMWQRDNKKIAEKINKLIQDIDRNGNIGIGQPEPLKYDLTGYWSRRITLADRLIYKIENNTINIIGCKGHYDDK